MHHNAVNTQGRTIFFNNLIDMQFIFNFYKTFGFHNALDITYFHQLVKWKFKNLDAFGKMGAHSLLKE